ncbi:MAG TPA: threonine/serine dehydratase [Blastocatellia bacterium]|nr:threonine/serine dehydratase [Blastocatellia bacterium]
MTGGIESVRQAACRIDGFARHTPLERSTWLSGTGREVWLKLECFQVTGSFKPRGAMARLATLSEVERSRGILTVSAGNHGLAVAHACSQLGLLPTIVVPRTASSAKVAAIRRYDVTLVESGDTYDEAEQASRAMERQTGMTFVSPYNDPDVIAGQGTIGLEMIAAEPDLDGIVVPVGGGGLIAGVLIAVKSLKPRIKVYGVEPSASPTMLKALEAGRLVVIPEEPTIADGLAGNVEPDSMTFPIIQRLVDDMILVDEPSIRKAMARVAREDHLMIEGSAAAAIAALADARLNLPKVAAVITGRNISLDLFLEIAR